MSKYISSIALAALSTLSAISLPAAVDATTLKTTNDNSRDVSLVSPQLPQQIALGCRGACLDNLRGYQRGSNVFFEWSGTGHVYNVRYKTTRGEKQVENRTGRFAIYDVSPNSVYSLSVQACYKPGVFSRSSCTGWQRASVTTLPY
jgi:hypothetical protein